MPRRKDGHEPGPGLRVLSDRRWYGPGYCGVCGDRGESLVPQAVRWWDPDDGWKMGVLCVGCGMDKADRGPKAGDFAVGTDDPARHLLLPQAERIDTAVGLGDLDAAYSDGQGRDDP